MNRLALPAVAGLASVLVATFALHYQTPGPETAALPQAPVAPSPSTTKPPSQAVADRQALVDTVLARPLFNPGRRPGPATAAGGPATLPRLSAVLVSSHGKAVIFAGPQDGKPVILAEGSRIAGYTVQSIGNGEVTLQGPDGTRVLRPAPASPSTSGQAATQAQPSMLDLLNRATPPERLTPLASLPPLR